MVWDESAFLASEASNKPCQGYALVINLAISLNTMTGMN